MQMIPIVTNYGKHSDERLAIECGRDIIRIGADAQGEQAVAGRKLENQIIEVLEKHFAAVSAFENDNMSHDHLMSATEAHPKIYKSAVDDVMATIADSPIAEWFGVTKDRRNVGTRDVAKNIKNSVARFIKISQHMHRDWFARLGKVGHGTELKDADGHDRDHEHVKRWIDMHDGPTTEAQRKAFAEHSAIVRERTGAAPNNQQAPTLTVKT